MHRRTRVHRNHNKRCIAMTILIARAGARHAPSIGEHLASVDGVSRYDDVVSDLIRVRLVSLLLSFAGLRLLLPAAAYMVVTGVPACLVHDAMHVVVITVVAICVVGFSVAVAAAVGARAHGLLDIRLLSLGHAHLWYRHGRSVRVLVVRGCGAVGYAARRGGLADLGLLQGSQCRGTLVIIIGCKVVKQRSVCAEGSVWLRGAGCRLVVVICGGSTLLWSTGLLLMAQRLWPLLHGESLTSRWIATRRAMLKVMRRLPGLQRRKRRVDIS
jgi:hypothetical protein